MRQTVDEKLQSTLETRLGESFGRVVEQLNRVHEGIGEMKNLAANVGDLKSVLTTVKVRGIYGEAQLELLLEQILSPEQYIKDARINDDSTERVEFAIRLPGKMDAHEVLLPIDAKFPRENYERLIEASHTADTKLMAHFRKLLESQIKLCAKDISTKYVRPPRMTDFAILFLATEGLFAEALREPGLFEEIQREYKVVLSGPTTLSALLNALQIGFRSLAIEKRSSEVWQVLGAVRNEFSKYNGVVETLSKQLNRAANSVDNLSKRTRVMTRTLRAVESLTDDATAQRLLGLNSDDVAIEEDAEDVSPDVNGTAPAPPIIDGV
jgi:DNA recombination protein RmuC